MLVVRSPFSYNYSLHFAHYLSDVHTWATFFLRHLANMSCMVPFWASTGSGFVPVWGDPCPKPCCPAEVVYSLNDSCSHLTQCLFPPKLPQQHTRLISYSTSMPFILIISHLYAHLHLLFYMSRSHIYFFGSSWPAGCPRLLVSDTVLLLYISWYVTVNKPVLSYLLLRLLPQYLHCSRSQESILRYQKE
jgi:hypothetical protein